MKVANKAESGRDYWRSLAQLEQLPEFEHWLHREFPQNATELGEHSRRTVLKLMAASFGLAGLTACRRPVEKILPFSRGVEDLIPGESVYYASSFSLGGVTDGIVIETHDGRPTKIEGNSQHPTGTGAATAFEQASILQLYDPDRAQDVLHNGEPTTWEEFETFVTDHLDRVGDGAGLRFLSESLSSPSLDVVRRHLLARFPGARWTEYEPLDRDWTRLAARIALGRDAQVRYDLSAADRVVSLDGDFLGLDWIDKTVARDFARRRRDGEGLSSMNRLYVAESRFSLTGAMADHRRRATHTDVVTLAVGLARELGLLADDAEELAGGAPADSDARRWLTAVARDLTAHRGRSLVIAGPRQPAAVQALAFWMNEALGNVGRTVMFSDRDASTGATQFESMPDLAAEMASGDVTTLVMIGGNPAFDGPADLGFANLLMQTPTTIRLGVGHNETSALSEWVLPAAHDLEAWGDGRAVDGSVTLQQPMIQPLYDGRSAAEFLALLGDYPDRAGYDIVRTHWQAVWGAPSDDRRWRRALHDGVVAESAHPTVEPDIDTNAIRTELAALANRTPVGIQLSFYPAASVYDGRFANNGWLQETPDPMTKLTWDNAALLSPATARDLDVAQSDLIEIDADGRSIEMPVLVQPGHADDAVSLFVGYGRTAAGRVGTGVGHNVYPLRTTDALWHLPSATLRKTGRRYLLACTQDHHSMEGRPIVREVSVGESLETSPGQTSDHAPLYHRPTGNDEANQWGMAIDLNTCIGCNACVVACQAENNIPIVGKVEVANGREMQWIRLDRYYVGDENDPQAVTQPVACQHCENAPCETVCPVAATVHSPEGLNDMVYNRCVGTRYCANNCPYKVRRFNYLDYHGELAETEKMAFNPNVTIRMRGVIEKCTYCVQRIQEAKITARTESRDVKDGEIKTACQQTCPAEAIVFGNIADPESQVARLRSDPRTYSMLDELNTKPRTTYLAKARNPNPELVADG